MLQTIRRLLLKIIDNIDAGNSNISTEEAIEVAKILSSYTDKEVRLSKYQACAHLGISRASFDNYVRNGKIPKGLKESGFKELFWTKKDLDKFLNTHKKQ